MLSCLVPTHFHADAIKQDRYAIQANSGNLILHGNEFQKDGNQVLLGSGVSKAAIVGNMFTGATRILDQGSKHKQIGLNVADDT